VIIFCENSYIGVLVSNNIFVVHFPRSVTATFMSNEQLKKSVSVYFPIINGQRGHV